MPPDSHGTLTRRVLALSEARGLSINRLAHAAGISQSYLSAVLRGESSPSLRTLDKVAGALGVEAWELICERDSPPESA